MGFFSNLRTTTRVAIAFGVLLAMLVAVAATSALRLGQLSTELDGVAVSRVPKIIQSARAIETLLQGSRQMRNVLILDDESEIKSQLVEIARSKSDVQEALGQVEKLLDGAAEKAAFEEVRQHEAAYEPLQAQYVALAQKGDYSTAKDFMIDKVRAAEAKYIEAISTLVEFQASGSEAAAREARERARATSALIFGVSLGAGLLGVLAAIVIIRTLRARLGEKSYAAQIANGIASGDLTSPVQVRRGDDEVILAAMKRMRDDLAEAVGSIRLSADAVGTAAGQIAAGNAELSSRTEEQASSLEETAASMEELASTVRQNSDNARQADDLARGASDRAVKGGEDVGRVIETMGEISTSASRIADIITVIDGIAFQTNILALNAAVEAARAGEQGRGFAVVASEVRSLAQRSADAAKEIKALIGDSVEKVANGKRAVEQAGGTIDGLVDDVKRVSDLMRAIAEASAEQSRGVQQVNKTVSEMDKVVQQNAAAVQQSVSAAESMRQQAQALVKAVSAFRLAEEGPRRAPVPEAVQVLERVKRLAAEQPVPMVATSSGPAVAARGDEWEEF